MIKPAILIASCDKNKKLLDIFFRYFQRFWNDCEYPVYVSLEAEDYHIDGMPIEVINDTAVKSWSSRIKNCLQKIDADTVILFMDDFILEGYVNQEQIKRYIQYLDKRTAAIILAEVPNEKNEMYSAYPDLVLRSRYARYKTSLQCGIWNKKVLLNLLTDNEDPWEFEIFGNIRSFLCDKEFYALADNKNMPIPYHNGLFLVQGMVNMEEKNRLEDLFQEKIELGNLPVQTGAIIRDRIKIIPRIFRRIKIMITYVRYRLLALRKRSIAGYGI